MTERPSDDNRQLWLPDPDYQARSEERVQAAIVRARMAIARGQGLAKFRRRR